MADTIIDIYCHIFPDRYFQEMTKVAPKLENIGKRLRGVTKLFDLDARFKEMDEFGDYRQIISLPNPAIEDIAKPDVGLESRAHRQRLRWPSCAGNIPSAFRPSPPRCA